MAERKTALEWNKQIRDPDILLKAILKNVNFISSLDTPMYSRSEIKHTRHIKHHNPKKKKKRT